MSDAAYSPEYTYYADPDEGRFYHLLTEMMDRQSTSEHASWKLDARYSDQGSIRLTSRVDRFLNDRRSILLLPQADARYHDVLALECYRIISISKRETANLQSMTHDDVQYAEMPAGSPVALENRPSSMKPRARLIRYSESQGCEIINEDDDRFMNFPSLHAFAGADLAAPIDIHIGNKAFATLDCRAAASIADGAIALDLTQPFVSDCGDLPPTQTTSMLLPDGRTQKSLMSVLRSASDPIYARIIQQRQQDLLHNFNQTREERLIGLLAASTQAVLEKGFLEWHL